MWLFGCWELQIEQLEIEPNFIFTKQVEPVMAICEKNA